MWAWMVRGWVPVMVVKGWREEVGWREMWVGRGLEDIVLKGEEGVAWEQRKGEKGKRMSSSEA